MQGVMVNDGDGCGSVHTTDSGHRLRIHNDGFTDTPPRQLSGSAKRQLVAIRGQKILQLVVQAPRQDRNCL